MWMDECEHGDYAEERWRRVDEALRREDGPPYWTTDQKSSLGETFFLLWRLHKNTVFITLFVSFLSLWPPANENRTVSNSWGWSWLILRVRRWCKGYYMGAKSFHLMWIRKNMRLLNLLPLFIHALVHSIMWVCVCIRFSLCCGDSPPLWGQKASSLNVNH